MIDWNALIRGHVAGIWKYRWYALTIAWLTSVAGWMVVERIPDRYMSSARVYVDTRSMIRPLMRGIAADVDSSALAQLDIVRRTLLSRPNLEKIMRETDLDVTAQTPAELDRIISELSARVQVGNAGPSLFSISFTDEKPALAHDVVRAVLNLFIESNIGANREQLSETQEFLEQQLNAVQQALSDGEKRLAELERENRGYLPGVANFEDRLRQAQATLVRLEDERTQSARLRDELGRELTILLRSVESNEPALSPQAARIAELQRQLDELSLRYTENHPDVILTKRLLERETALLASDASKDAALSSPAVEQLRLQMRRLEANLQRHDEQIDHTKLLIEDLTAKLDSAPVVETAIAQMRRDLDVTRRNYQELVMRREQARFAEKLEVQTEAIQFRIVDPPTTPSSPAEPNRPMLRSGVFVGGVGAGIAFAVLLWLISGTFNDPRRLESVIGRPVLGSISKSILARSRSRRTAELAGFTILVLCLVVTYGIVMTGRVPITFII